MFLSKSSPVSISLLLTLLATIWTQAASAQEMDTTVDSLSDSREIPITIDNFIRAATDLELGKYVSLAGGVNRFFHFREPTPVDDQPTIRMNRDTLYSTAVIDISEGATLTLPNADGRYMTAMVLNQDHYIEEVIHGGGTYALDVETFGTPYVVVFMRVLVDAADPSDVAAVNALQDQMLVEAGSARPFILPNYDEASFEGLLKSILALGPYVPDSSHMFGARDQVQAVRHLIGTAGGWGGLPEHEAYYVGVEPNLPVAEYRIDVPAEVPVGAFWSVSLYNARGFFQPNAQDAYNVNSVTGARNGDGSMTIHLGGCLDGRVNCLPIMEGWNYTVRMYQPGPEVLDGTWSFPPARLLN